MRLIVLGAAYGALLAQRALAAGIDVTLVGHDDEIQQIEARGLTVRFPPGPTNPEGIELHSERLPGRLRMRGCDAVDPAEGDLIVLAMQEPHFAAPGPARLLARIGASGRPCLSLMNMPPPPYLERIPALRGLDVSGCFAAPEAWRGLSADRITLSSPDPQATRPADGALDALVVGLASNFRVAPFARAGDQMVLERLARAVNDARIEIGARRVALPVRVRPGDGLLLPLTKWAMLMAGNYRCLSAEGIVSIREAVLARPEESRAVYGWVEALLRALGLDDRDRVPFAQYARAAERLVNPSSVARALEAGRPEIERVDLLVLRAARHLGLDTAPVEPIVARVEARLERNRRAAARDAEVRA